MDLETNLRTLRRRARVGATIHIIVLIALLILCGIALRESATRFLEGRTLGAGLTTLFLGSFEILFVWHLITAVSINITDRPRVVPYFPQKYFDRKASEESWEAFRGGYSLAADLHRLDDLAKKSGITPLSSFGFADDLLNQAVQWSSADDGIRTVTSLIQEGSGLSTGTLADLAALAAALKKAAEHQKKFSLLVRFGKDDYISGVELSKRLGTFWC